MSAAMRLLRCAPLVFLFACGGSDGTNDDMKAASCPANLATAEGTHCSDDGQSCGGDQCASSCGFCNYLVCHNGKWSHIEVLPGICDGGV